MTLYFPEWAPDHRAHVDRWLAHHGLVEDSRRGRITLADWRRFDRAPVRDWPFLHDHDHHVWRREEHLRRRQVQLDANERERWRQGAHDAYLELGEPAAVASSWMRVCRVVEP